MNGPGGPPNKLGQGYNPGYNPTHNIQQKPPKPKFNFKTKTIQSEITPDLMAQQLASFGTTAKYKTQQSSMNQSNNASQNTFSGQFTFPGNQQMFSGQQQMFQVQQRFQNPQTLPYRAYGQGFGVPQTQHYGQSFQPATYGSQPIRNPHSTVGNDFSAVGNPPSAFGNLSSAVGNPPSAFGNPPSAIGNPPPAFGNPPSGIRSPSSTFGNPPSSNSSNFSTYGCSAQNFAGNQTSINFHNMGLSSNISSKQGSFNQLQEPSITPLQNISNSAITGDLFDIFTSSRTQSMKPQPIVAEDDPFLTLRNKQLSTNPLNNNAANKADLFGSAPFMPQNMPTPSTQNDTFGSFPTSSTMSSIKSSTLSSDLFVSTQITSNSSSSNFVMSSCKPAVKPITPQCNQNELFSRALFTSTISERTKSEDIFQRTTTPTVSDLFTSNTEMPRDMFGSTPFITSTQPDKFAAFDSLSTPALGQTLGVTPISDQSENKFSAFNSASTPDHLDRFAAFDNTQSTVQPDNFAAFMSETREASVTPPLKDKYSAFSDLTLDDKGFEPMFGDSIEPPSGGTFPPTVQLQKLPGQLTKPPIPHKRPTSNESAASSDPFSSTKLSPDLFDQALLSGISGAVSMTKTPTNSAAVDFSIFDPAPLPKQSISSHKESNTSTSLFDQTPFDPFATSSSPAAQTYNLAAFEAAFDTPVFDQYTANSSSVGTPSPASNAPDGIKVSRPTPTKKSTLLLLPPPAKPSPRGNVPKLPPKRHESAPQPVKKPEAVVQLIVECDNGAPPQPPRSYEGKKVPTKPPTRPSTKRPAPPPPSRPSTVQLPVSSHQTIDILSDIFGPTSTTDPTQVSPTNLLDDDILDIPAPPLPKREIKTQPLLIIPAGDPRTAPAAAKIAPSRPVPPGPQDKYAVFKETISAEQITELPASYSTPPPLPPRPTPGHELYHYIMRTEPHCIANFDFVAEDAEELEFKVGDMIVLTSVVSDAWFEGTVGNRTGMFPKNLVDVKIPLRESSTAAAFTPNPSFDSPHVPEQPKTDIFDAWKNTGPPSPPSPSSSSSSSYRESSTESPILQDCVVLYDFAGAEDDELSLVEGQIIHIIDFVGDDWAKGKCGGKEGIFPTSYVDLSSNVNVEAFQPFRSEEPDDLPPRPTAEELKTPSPHVEAGDPSESPLVEAGDPSESPSGPTTSSEDRSFSVSDRHVLCAEYDFIPEADDELQLVAGEEVEVVAIVDEEWLRGRVGDNEGIFPTGFVPPLPQEWNLPTVSQYLENFESETSDTTSLTSDRTSVLSEIEDMSSLDESSHTLGKAEAILDFETENDFELQLTKGDVLTVTGRLTDTWLEGECNGATGIFPSEFVKWTEGGDVESHDELVANPCVADDVPRNLEREETITNFNPEDHYGQAHQDTDRTPKKQTTLTEIITRLQSGEGSDGVTTPSFSSSNPFADPLEVPAPSITPDDKYGALDSNLFNALDSFLDKENPFTPGDPQDDPFTSSRQQDDPFTSGGQQDDPFTSGGQQDDPFKSSGQQDDPFTSGGQQVDPFMSDGQQRVTASFSTQEDPFESNVKEDLFPSNQNDDPFKKSEDLFAAIKKDDPFESIAVDPFKSNEDPFAESTNDAFDNKSNDPFDNTSNDPFDNKSTDLFSSDPNDHTFNSKFSQEEEDPFKSNERDLFGRDEDAFSPMSEDNFSSESKVVLYKMKALYAFEPDNEDELAFTEGDVIEIIEEVNEEWLIGQCRENEGLFPAAFAEKL